jgi:hypothetical protein
MDKIKSVALLLLAVLVCSVLQPVAVFSATSVGKVKELIGDKTRELYVDKVNSAQIPDTQQQKVSVNLICKNLLATPNACMDIFFFTLLDGSGNHYQPKLAESRIMSAKIPTRDIEQGILTFVMPVSENPTQLVYSEPKNPNFLANLTLTKEPADKAPVSEWRLGRNEGLTFSDTRIELKILDETHVQSQHILDISIRNKGGGIVDYNALYMYLKTVSGAVFVPSLYADVQPRMESGTLQPGQHVRAKVAFDVGTESGPFMYIYDDIAGSFFASGKFVPQSSTVVKGEIIDTGDLVKISEHKAYSDPITGAYRIIGAVSNNSTSYATEIRVHAILQDRVGKVLAEVDSGMTNFLSSAPVTLAPGAKLPFFLDFDLSEAVIKSIGSYELSLKYSFSEAKSKSLSVKSAEIIQASKPTPLSKYILWQIKGQITNNGDVRSTHTHITASVYDSQGGIIGVAGFSVRDEQPRDFNPGRTEEFSIDVAMPTALKPSSFYLYAESDQHVIAELKNYGKVQEDLEPSEPEPPEPLPVQLQNYTGIGMLSKQRQDVLQIVVKNLPNSTGMIYGMQIALEETGIHTLKTKLRWNSEELGNEELLLSTANNPIRPGQKARFLFDVNSDVHVIFWKVLDVNGTIISEGKVEPFQVR